MSCPGCPGSWPILPKVDLSVLRVLLCLIAATEGRWVEAVSIVHCHALEDPHGVDSFLGPSFSPATIRKDLENYKWKPNLPGGFEPGMVLHTYNPSTWEVESAVQSQPGLCKTLPLLPKKVVGSRGIPGDVAQLIECLPSM